MANAGNTLQIFRFLWDTVKLEKLGCPHDNRSQVRANFQRHHVCVQSITKAYSCIKSLSYYIDESIAFDDLQPDIRILL
ncbi:hypothetical protein SOD10_38880 [Serratia plymuthica]|nr:hypothetical protein SOD10_38880 [Serratia plymuthica]